ncbi:MAG: hypothetical protein JKY74_15690 [Shewanella sp.]|nr:hypothetical protein [Shewanella sp.]
MIKKINIFYVELPSKVFLGFDSFIWRYIFASSFCLDNFDIYHMRLAASDIKS